MKYMLLLLGFISIQLYAQWSSDPDENLHLTNWGDLPIDIVSDGKGGAFFTTGFSEPINQPPWSVSHPYLLWIDKYGEHNIDTVSRMLGKGDATWKAALFEDGMGAYFGVFTIKNIENAQPAYTVYKL